MSDTREITHPLISADPAVMVGKPCIAGTRITVELIVRRFAEGYTAADILEDYPHLTAAGVQAALEYAADLAGRIGPTIRHPGQEGARFFLARLRQDPAPTRTGT